MKSVEKKYLADPQAGLDADSADFIVPINDWVNAENVRTGTTDAGVTGTVESVGGTLLLSTIEPSITNVELGSVADAPNNRILYLTKSLYSPQDKILCYDKDADTVYTVLLSSQVTGGLNFDKNYPIHSLKVIDGVLYWVNDDINEPRRVDINAGIELNHPGTYPDVTAYTSPVAQSVLTVVRNPPAFPVTFEKSQDVGFTLNFIKKEAFQLYYGYVYRGGEESVLSPLSQTANYNPDDGSAASLYNLITIEIPFDETIQQDVQRVELCAKFLNSATTYIIKTWDKDNATDAAEIAAHNVGTTELTYEFYNDQSFRDVGQIKADKPFDFVPIYSKAMEVVENRLFFGNITEGYDTPLTNSLSVQVSSINTSGGGSFDVYIAQCQFRAGSSYFSYRAYYANLTTISPAGYYRLTNFTATNVGAFGYPAYPTLAAVPASITTDEIVYVGTTSGDVQNSISPANVDSFSFTDTGSNTNLTISTGVTSTQKTNSTKQVGIVFYDAALRRCGVFTDSSLIVNIPDRDYNLDTLYTGISWELDNTLAATEIPEFAVYYQIVVTNALDLTSFVQAVAPDVKYVTQNAQGDYVYNSSLVGNEKFVAINLDYLTTYGIGYQFSDKDLVRIYQDSGVEYDVEVRGQDGRYLLCSFIDMGSLLNEIFLFQIWTPFKYNTNPAFYEVAQLFEVINSGEANRAYSVTNGVIRGDVNIRTRTHNSVNYRVERMSPQDALWQNWWTDAGRTNIIDKIGQQNKQTGVRWSNKFIPGTLVNGLSSFDYLDEKILPEQLDSIQKLQLSSKVQDEQGVVMLAIGEDETASCYMGEVQMYNATQASDIVSTDAVIGTVNILKGSFGTIDPQSVTEFKGNVFWLDRNSCKVIQYSGNGLYPISNYKMTRYWKQFCDQYNSMTISQIEALGSRPFVFMTVDPHHFELLISVPKLLANPPKGYLPDYPSTVYPFDIWDGREKTIVYKLISEPNRWMGAFTFNTENFITLGNDLYSFKYGQLFIHNQVNNYANFYGTQYKSRIMCLFNMNPNLPKVYNSIAVEGNLRPTLTYFRTEPTLEFTEIGDLWEQASDLVDFDYSVLEGQLYATLYRNKLVPTATGLDTTGLLTAEKMRALVLKVMIEFTVGSYPLELRYLQLGFDDSRGHQT